MNDITSSKFTKEKKEYKSNNISKVFSKILLSVIFVLASLIYTNLSSKNYALYKEKVINNNIRYPRLKKLYEKYFGKILPNPDLDSVSVFNSSLSYKKIEDYKSGEKMFFDGNTVVEAIQSGIVVFIGDKDNLGNTVIIQGIDDVDIWYSNINNCNLKLYDYVEKNKVVGEADKELILNIIKNNTNVKYEDYIKTL